MKRGLLEKPTKQIETGHRRKEFGIKQSVARKRPAAIHPMVHTSPAAVTTAKIQTKFAFREEVQKRDDILLKTIKECFCSSGRGKHVHVSSTLEIHASLQRRCSVCSTRMALNNFITIDPVFVRIDVASPAP